MKFVAKKSRSCVRAGHVCHEFETGDIQKMADYILKAYAYGAEGCDRRDNDYACVYDCLAEFKKERFVDDDEKKSQLANDNGIRSFGELPTDSNLLYMAGSFGWDLTPVKDPHEIIDELLSVEWGDLTIEFDD